MRINQIWLYTPLAEYGVGIFVQKPTREKILESRFYYNIQTLTGCSS